MSTAAIDLSRLPVPNVIEELDYETILAEQLADLVERDSSFTGLQESDPAIKVLQVTAYRELQVRQRVNEAARAVMLAYALDADLDNLGAWMDVPRLVITPADTEKATDAVMESNDDYRRRIQLAPQGFSVAGPEGAYIFHALSADSRVLDAKPASPSPGKVVVTLLSRVGDGMASAELLAVVEKFLREGELRPLTDYVLVQSADIVRYRVKATLITFKGPDASVALAEAQRRCVKYVTDSHRLGLSPSDSGFKAALHVEGVQRVELEEPGVLAISPTQAAYCTGIEIVHGGLYGE